MNKKLVVYFSVSGVTAKVAKELAAVEQADLIEIVPAAAYTREDLDYTNKLSRSSVEMADLNCRPEIKTTVECMSQYETVYVGFPIWWGREPSVVDTFLTSCDFKGKRIIPFCTSGGSGIGKTAERIRTLVDAEACVDAGTRLGSDVSEEDLKLWTAGL